MIIPTITGAIVGGFTGLIPGFHTNNIAPIFLGLPLAEPQLFVFSAAAASSFTVTSHVPSVMIGAPSGENISVLPGHRLMNKGRGTTAIYLASQGAFISSLTAPITGLVFLSFASELYPVLSVILPFLLILITLLMARNLKSILISSLAATLGLVALENVTIMPMLTGFFGISTLLVSLVTKETQKRQKLTPDSKASNFKTKRSALLSTSLSTFFGVIPAVSSAITAVTGRLFGDMDEEEYISFIGACNTTYVLISFLALVSIGKTRSGMTAMLASTLFPRNPLIVILAVMVSTSIAYLTLRINLGRIAKTMNSLNHRKITISSLVFLVLLNIALTNMKGLIVLATSTAIGITAVKLKVSRVTCMSSLTIPTALLLLK